MTNDFTTLIQMSQEAYNPRAITRQEAEEAARKAWEQRVIRMNRLQLREEAKNYNVFKTRFLNQLRVTG